MRSFRHGIISALAAVILATMWCPTSSWSQAESDDRAPGLTASLDRDDAKVGSLVVLTLRYQLPEGGRLTEELQINGLEGLTIVEREVGPGEIRIKFLVDRLDPWKSDTLSLAYLDEDEEPQILKADPVSLRVLSNLGEKPAEAQLRPIQGIMPTQPVWLNYLLWTAVFLGLLLAGAGFLWWRKRRRAQWDSFELEEPPHIRAQKEIEQLLAKGIFEKGYVKEFYFAFTEILRRYLGALRDFPAAEFTTEEIVRHVDNQQDRKLLPLLREADFVKFADKVPTPTRKEEDVKIALAYIEETSPISEDSRAREVSYEVVE